MKLVKCTLEKKVYTGGNNRAGGRRWGTIVGIMGDREVSLGIPAGSILVRRPCGQLCWHPHTDLKRKK